MVCHSIDRDGTDSAFCGPTVTCLGSLVLNSGNVGQLAQIVEVGINGLPATFHDLAFANGLFYRLVTRTFF